MNYVRNDSEIFEKYNNLKTMWQFIPGGAVPQYLSARRLVTTCLGTLLQVITDEKLFNSLTDDVILRIAKHLTTLTDLSMSTINDHLFIHPIGNLLPEIEEEALSLLRYLVDAGIRSNAEISSLINKVARENEVEATQNAIDAQRKEVEDRENSLRERLQLTESLELKNRMLEEKLDDLLKRYEMEAVALSGKLSDAKRAALSTAFSTRSDDAKRAKWFWATVLLLALASMLAAAFFYSQTMSLGSLGPNLNTGISLLLKFSVAAPLIWIAWFSARQFGYMSKIQEDYLYKVAMTLTHDAYRASAVDVNAEMSNKLLDATILTISENPIRIYSAKQEAGTPLHDVAAELGLLEKIVKLVRGETTKRD